ncbi:MAG: hypothetical protein BGO98_30695 [Myxococcales bacterium 68-20]|nr:MAG: hypothetical protein BGO98_30695 [Myxococcales bacterium 68-20]
MAGAAASGAALVIASGGAPALDPHAISAASAAAPSGVTSFEEGEEEEGTADGPAPASDQHASSPEQVIEAYLDFAISGTASPRQTTW